jgi:uncharacterized protein (TIGR00297 family)
MGILRKVIHLSMGFFALALRWLNPWQAMLCALIAFLHNVYIFPLYGRKKLEKEEEKKRGYTAIASYPMVVFGLILLSYMFNNIRIYALTLAAASWAVLAFGDSLGAIVGMTLKGPKLHWNKDKTYSGLIGVFFFGAISSYFMIEYFNKAFFSKYARDNVNLVFCNSDNWLLLLIILAAFLAAIVESLDGQFDDNLGFPFVALSVLSFTQSPLLIDRIPFVCQLFSGKGDYISYNLFALIIVINVVLAVTAFRNKWVSLWGFIFGLLVGFSVIFSLGVKGFAILCLFYLFANFSTFYGKRIKEERGIAEGNKGTRGLESVFSKGLVPAIFCWLSFEAFIVALAFYAADTIATEFGKTSKSGTFSLLSFKGVPPGTVGAVSIKGTLAGTISILVFLTASLLNYKTFEIDLKVCTALSALVLLFFILESIINELNAKFGLTSKMVIHITLGFLAGAFANTIMLAIHWFLS